MAACSAPAATTSFDGTSPKPPPPSATGNASPEPSASVDSTPATSAAPSAAPSHTAGTIAPDTLVEVIVADLIVRSEPGVEAGAGTILPDRLTMGDRAYVVAGPVMASGYEWYQVDPLTRADGSAGTFGWIAVAGRDGEAWVQSSTPPCPATVDLAGVLALAPLERLACFGDESLTLTAQYGMCGAGGGPWTWDPSWLVMIGGCALSLDANADGPGLVLRVPPGVTRADDTPPITVSGHFDDPAAATCTVTTADPAYPAPSPAQAVMICRTEFVVEG